MTTGPVGRTGRRVLLGLVLLLLASRTWAQGPLPQIGSLSKGSGVSTNAVFGLITNTPAVSNWFVMVAQSSVQSSFGYQTNFATTNTDAGLTNAILQFFTNNAGGGTIYITNLFATNLYATNIFVSNEFRGKTVITTNFFTTNIFGLPATNWVLTILTNNGVINSGIGPGTLNQIALFGTTTTNVTNSVLFQTFTNCITLIPSYSTSATFTKSSTNQLYGAIASATDFQRFEMVAGTGVNDYDELHGVAGSGNTSGPAGVPGVPPLKLHDWLVIESATPQSGHAARSMYPLTDNVMSIGNSSLRVHDITFGTGSITFVGTPSTTTINNNFWAVGLPSTSIDFYRNVSSSATLSSRFGTVGSTAVLGWDFAGNILGFGTGVGSDTSFIGVSASSNLGEVQLGTNNAGAATPQKVTLTGAIGTGSNHGGSCMDMRGGYGTGTARNGDFTISTAPSTAGSGATANNSYVTNFYISAQPVTLTKSSATLVCNVTVPSGKVAGITVEGTTYCTDNTDFQGTHDIVNFSAVNKGGTVTPSSVGVANSVSAVSTGTQTTTWSAVANGNSVDIKCNAVPSLTPGTLQLLGGYSVRVQCSGQCVITPQ